ncbi:methyl-accepting chemotaxis protein [Azospirillum sp. ST 5-10]|uniref:methyl-accepting chemotaxis protein n=1 Tax=unclassified Azospirillum TaxID=2630922 RepID=UPI003F49FCE8
MTFSDLSIRAKVLVVAGPIALAAFAAVSWIGVTSIMDAAEEGALEQLRIAAGRYAAEVGAAVGSPVAATDGAAKAIEGLLAAGAVDRTALGEAVKGTLAGLPHVVGMTLAFEPNGLDGRDAAFKDHAFADATGRYVPYFYHAPGGIAVETLVMTKEAGTEEWYDKPVRENRSLLTPPYTYPVNGKEVLMTTASVVVHRGGRPVGILTVDQALTSLSDTLGRLRPLGVGTASLIGGGDLWVVNPDAARLGKPVADRALLQAAAEAARAGTANLAGTAPDGREILRVLAPVSFPAVGERWTLMVEVPRDAVMAAAGRTRLLLLGVSGLGVLVLCLGLWAAARSVARPIGVLTATLSRLAEGDLTSAVEGTHRGDEVGAMARAVDVLKQHSAEARRLAAEQERLEAQAEQRRRDGILAVAAEFETTVRSVVGALAGAAARMRGEAGTLQTLAADGEARTNAASEATSQASANVQAVSSAAEQMAHSVTEIARLVARSGEIARAAESEVSGTNATVDRLADSSRRIGEITGLIQNIAGQTNLLALNATIESARAGEAGKGFAVVANEVKALAGQTARATEEIASQIAVIQQVSAETVEAMARIAQTIGEMNGFGATIAAAVDEQEAATREIARNVQEAAVGSSEVARNVEGLAGTARAIGSASGAVSGAAADVAEKMGELEMAADALLTRMRAA